MLPKKGREGQMPQPAGGPPTGLGQAWPGAGRLMHGLSPGRLELCDQQQATAS